MPDPTSDSEPEAGAASGDGLNLPSGEVSPIPDDAVEDIPPGSSAEIKTKPVVDPEADHRRGMDKIKLTFGIKLIAWCLGVFVVLSVAQFLLQQSFPDAAALTAAMDLLKLIATTALGFVFGRTLDSDKKQ